MAHGSELLPHCTTDALCGRIRIEELGVLGFELAQLVHKRVERTVRNLGRVLHVIQIDVVVDFLTQRLDTLAGIVVEQAQRFVHANILLRLRRRANQKGTVPFLLPLLVHPNGLGNRSDDVLSNDRDIGV